MALPGKKSDLGSYFCPCNATACAADYARKARLPPPKKLKTRKNALALPLWEANRCAQN